MGPTCRASAVHVADGAQAQNLCRCQGFSWNLRIPCEAQLRCQLQLSLQYISLYFEYQSINQYI